jgi:hypothetical protein
MPHFLLARLAYSRGHPGNKARSFFGSSGCRMRTLQGATMDWQCRCTTVEHKHLDNRCPKPAVTADGYCQECHDKAAKEAMDAQEITQGD